MPCRPILATPLSSALLAVASTESLFTRRVLIVLVLGVLTLALLALVWHAFSVVLLVFAGVLLAVLLDGLASALARHTPLGRTAALAVVIALWLAAIVGFFLFVGPRVAEQFTDLQTRIPTALDGLRAWLDDYGWGQTLLDAAPEPSALRGSDLLGRVTGLFSTALGVVVDVVVVAFVGIYGAVNPGLYTGAVVRLVPGAHRGEARELFEKLGGGLRGWLLGRFSSMAVVGTLVATGLFILGVPLALTLGLLAALFSFVPYLGPIASTVPAVLVALSEGPDLVLWVLGLYALVEVLESYLITPLIQQRAVSMPPALLIVGQVLFGVAGGVWGVIFATPIIVCLIIAVQVLYVEDTLHEEVEVMGE